LFSAVFDKQDMKHLNDLYEDYLCGMLERKNFEGLVYKYLLDNKAVYNFYRWNTEEYVDFLSAVYPRLKNAIDAYRDNGASFESYVCAIIRGSQKEHRLKHISKSITEYAAWSVHVPDMYAREEPPEYAANNSASNTEDLIYAIINNSGGRIKNPRQLLALILKCYYYLSDDFIDKIAPTLEMEPARLRALVDKLREIRLKRDNELYEMRERIYCQFYRCVVYEKKISLSDENSDICAALKRKRDKARKRLASMRKRIAGMRTDATNRQVALVMGVKKGSVDSCLYNLKTKWKINIDKSILN